MRASALRAAEHTDLTQGQGSAQKHIQITDCARRRRGTAFDSKADRAGVPPATPEAIYTALPKALPANSRDADTHLRIRHDRIDDSGVITVRHAGKLHHIGLGRTHARTHVIGLIADLDIRIVNAATGELLRHLTLNPDVDYQPQNTENP